MGLGFFMLFLLVAGAILFTVLHIKLSSKKNPLWGLCVPLGFLLFNSGPILYGLILNRGFRLDGYFLLIICILMYLAFIYALCRLRIEFKQRDANLWEHPTEDSSPHSHDEPRPSLSYDEQSYHKDDPPRRPNGASDALSFYRRRRNKLFLALFIALIVPLLLLYPMVFSISSLNLAFTLSFLLPLLVYLAMMYRDIREVWSAQIGILIGTAIASNFLFVLQSEIAGLVVMPLSMLTVAYTGKEVLAGYRQDRDLGVTAPSDFSAAPSPNFGRIVAIALIAGVVLCMGVIGGGSLLERYENSVYRLNGVTVNGPGRLRKTSSNELLDKKERITYTFELLDTEQDYQELLREEESSVRSKAGTKTVYRLANFLANEGYSTPKYPDVNMMELHTASGSSYYYDVVVTEWEDSTLEMTAITPRCGKILKITAVCSKGGSVRDTHKMLKEFIRSSKIR